MTPRVSVVIPTRNRRAMLRTTLATVLAQRDVELDVIVVDDCSTDGTHRMIGELDDPRVRCIRNRSCRGAAGSRNVGIDAARFELVAFVDDDDLWSPTMLARHVAAIRSAPGTRWSTAACVEVNPDLSTSAIRVAPDPTELPRRLLSGNPVPGGCSNVVVETGLVRDVGGFDETFEMMADWDLWIRLSQVSAASTVAEPTALYVLHDGNMSLQVRRSERELVGIGRKHATARAAAGVSGYEDGVRRWMAERAGSSGLGLLAARLLVALAVQTRSIAPLVLAAHALRGPASFSAAVARRRGPASAAIAARSGELVDEVRAVLADAGTR